LPDIQCIYRLRGLAMVSRGAGLRRSGFVCLVSFSRSPRRQPDRR